MATYNGDDKRLQYLFGKTNEIEDGLIKTTFVGATSAEDGSIGLVPAPTAGQEGLYLQANGTWSEPSGGGALPGTGYTGSDLILRDENGNISGVYYVDENGNWVEYKTAGGTSGHTFALESPAEDTITNSFEITSEVT